MIASAASNTDPGARLFVLTSGAGSFATGLTITVVRCFAEGYTSAL
jgi:hypothetical protein